MGYDGYTPVLFFNALTNAISIAICKNAIAMDIGYLKTFFFSHSYT